MLLVCIVCPVLVLLGIGTVGCDMCIQVPSWFVLSLEVVVVYGIYYQYVKFLILNYFNLEQVVFGMLVWSHVHLIKNCQVEFFSSPPPRVLLHIDVWKYNNV